VQAGLALVGKIDIAVGSHRRQIALADLMSERNLEGGY
jgi:hypothetical protein